MIASRSVDRVMVQFCSRFTRDRKVRSDAGEVRKDAIHLDISVDADGKTVGR